MGKISKFDVSLFQAFLENNLFVLHGQLKTGAYVHDIYTHFYIHDPKKRYISKATVKDRIVHQAVVQVIEPFFEKQFIFDSYSSRRSKGVLSAVLRLEKFLRQASTNYHCVVYALKCDVRKFFDSIDHEILMSILTKTIIDGPLLNLLKQIIKSYSSDDVGGKGLPLGNVTSQLFANIYLNSFDHFVKEKLRMQWYLRFCDDFVILNAERPRLDECLLQIRKFLRQKKKLELHPKKVSIRKLSHGVDFVGQILRPYYKVLRTKTKRRIFRNVNLNLEEFEGGQIEDEKFRQILQSHLGLLRHGQNYKLEKKMRDSILMNILK